MSYGDGRRSTGWQRRASAAGRGLLWWWRAFSECFRHGDTEESVNHKGHEGARRFIEMVSFVILSVLGGGKGPLWKSRKSAYSVVALWGPASRQTRRTVA